MRVGFSTCMIQGGKSGVAQYVFALLRALLQRPDHPELSLFALEADLPLFQFAVPHAQIIPVPERYRRPIRNIFWHQCRLPDLVRRLRLDAMHVPSYRRMLWLKPCPLVATIHDLAPFHVQAKYDPARMFYGRVLARALAKRQDQIIAVSQHTANDVQRFFGIPPARIHVIRNGLDHGRFQPAADSGLARAEVARRWGVEHPYLLYVSRLEHPAKNHVRLLEAFSQFKQSTGSDWLLVLGGSDWHGADAIHAAAADSPARDSIRFLGFVPDADLPCLYQAAAALVYPSLFEGFGFPPVEAMASGCPVLSSTRGALGEVVGDAAGYLNPEDIHQMASALQRVVHDPAWREHLREAGFRNARRFDWSQNADRVLDCYRRTCHWPTKRSTPGQDRSLSGLGAARSLGVESHRESAPVYPRES